MDFFYTHLPISNRDSYIYTVKQYLNLVKFSHTIFAMPFAMLGVFLAIHLNGLTWSWDLFVLVILCMVFARNAAMAFNRYLDSDIDGLNERTSSREIPSGIIKPKSALIFVMINAVLFILTTFFINPLCFYLSPIALIIILGYSYTKRFTALSHFVLGLGLSLAPIGAYMAISGNIHLLPTLYGLAVLFWVAGFDIVYSLQDEQFDAEMGLHSTPTLFGSKKALMISRLLHISCAIILCVATFVMNQSGLPIGYLHWAALIIFCALLVYQHKLIKHDDLSKINLAFFTTNGLASVIFSILIIVDLYL